MNVFRPRPMKLIGLSGLILAAWLMGYAQVSAASFNQSRLVEDIEFTNVNSMTTEEVQRFLVAKGSFLAQFTENGRTAAQIIVDAAHGVGDGSGTVNGISIFGGSVSPAVILVTLQKEQSLVTMTSQNDAALRTAMGYACPDSGGCNPSYATFTKQVENGAWQLRYNYERAQGRGFSDFQVGQSACFSNPSGGTDCVTYNNRATSALYRYTPHVYNGNYNFWNLFTNVYQFTMPEYFGQHSGQTTSSATLWPGQSTTFSIAFRNAGRATWSRATPVNLAVDKFENEAFGATLQDSSWLSRYRISQLPATTVAPGETATFPFTVRVPETTQPGSYRFDARLVADGITWFGPNTNGAGWWRIQIAKTSARWVGQSANPTLSRGEHATFNVQFRNTSGATWKKTDGPQVNLAVDKHWANETAWQGTGWLSSNRIVSFAEDSVADGQIGTFTFDVAVPETMPSGAHRFYVRLVADGFSWFENPDTNGGAWWQINVN